MEIKKNDVIDVEITDIGSGGEGIGKADGFTFFVKDAVPGDKVKAHITKVKKTYAYAKTEKVISPSPFRVIPECEFAVPCGGCQLQALSYDRELEYKKDKVKNALIRIGGFDEEFTDEVMLPVIGMDEGDFRYRNKMQIPFGTDKEGNIIAGFYAGRTHNIISCSDCLLGFEEHKDILSDIISFAKENSISVYDEKTGKGILRHALLRKGFATGEIMVCLIVNADKLPHADALTEKLLKRNEFFKDPVRITSISINVNKENTNVILGKKCDLLWGKEYITDKIGSLTFRISPLSFYQVNPIQTKKLYDTALSFASLTGRENVLDLYCGTGTISLFLAQKAGRVHGVEIVPEAIKNAKENAVLNGIVNATFSVGKAEDLTEETVMGFFDNSSNVDVIVVDPPRKGCDPACIDTMLRLAPSRIVYVSCDPATLARDLKILCAGGYEIVKVRPTDMFKKTVHVESCVLLTRVSNRKADSYVKLNVKIEDYYRIKDAEKKTDE